MGFTHPKPPLPNNTSRVKISIRTTTYHNSAWKNMPSQACWWFTPTKIHPLVLNQGLRLQYEDHFILNSRSMTFHYFSTFSPSLVKPYPSRLLAFGGPHLVTDRPSILTVVPVICGGWFLPSFGPSLFSFLLMGRCGGGGGAWWMIPSILRPIFLFVPFNGTVRWGWGCMVDDSFHPLAHLFLSPPLNGIGTHAPRDAEESMGFNHPIKTETSKVPPSY